MIVTPAVGAHSRVGYRPEVDGLRAVAVVAVIVNHLDAALLPAGFLGVDVFFVISGYVITASLWGARFASLGDLLQTFYARRVRRLLPALIFCVVVTALAAAVVALPPDPSLKTGIASLFGLSNVLLLRWATDYFAAPTALNTFTHTWSLGVEEQFYVGYPLLLWFTWLGRRGTRGWTTPAIAVAILSALSLAGFLALGGQARPVSFYLMPARIWELGAGCLLFMVRDREPAPPRAASRVNAAGTVALLVLLGWTLFADALRAPLWTVAAAGCTALLIAFLRPGTPAFRLLTNRVVLTVGLMSYSLYLWHWSVFSIARWTVGVTSRSAPFLLVAMAALAMASYHLVEKPLRGAAWSPSRLRTLGYGVSASVAAALVLFAFLGPLGAPLLALGQRLVPTAVQPPGLLHDALRCDHPQRIADPVGECLAAREPRGRAIFVIGDSHASNHVPSIEAAVRGRPDVQVRYLVETGAINEVAGAGSCIGDPDCIEQGFSAQLRLLGATLRPTDLVVFSWANERVIRGGEWPRTGDAALLERLSGKLEQLRDTVLARGATLVLVEDIPQPCRDHVAFIVDVLRQGRFDHCLVSTDDSHRDRAGLSRVYHGLVRDGVLLFDPHDYLCADGWCRVTAPGTTDLLYGDASPHFAPRYGEILAEPWREFLAGAWPAE